MKVVKGSITKRIKLNVNLFEIHISLDSDMGEYRPGNFVMLSFENCLSPFLPRPFSIYDFKGNMLKLIFKVVGKGTKLLAETNLPYKIRVWGPLGNSFPLNDDSENIVVAGGLGLVPLFNLNKFIKISNFFVGFKNQSESFLAEELKKSYNVTISTDDGSLGKKGFITQYFEEYLNEIGNKKINIYACGPHPFLKKMWQIGKSYKLENIFASFETVMACGFGVCLGCAIETPFGYVKVCKKGPVFNIYEIFG
ncbi:MAG: dihydroorotate dehydrogenase electron transfer subunit [bacterium]